MKAFLLALFLVACQRPLTPSPPPPPPEEISLCSEMAEVRGEDVCSGLFTDDGHACFDCKNVSGCLDGTTQIYCVVYSCLDARCKIESF